MQLRRFATCPPARCSGRRHGVAGHPTGSDARTRGEKGSGGAVAGLCFGSAMP